VKKKEKNYTIVAQSCDSRKCKKKYKHEITEMCEAITTPQKIDMVKKTATCLYCGKTFKF